MPKDLKPGKGEPGAVAGPEFVESFDQDGAPQEGPGTQEDPDAEQIMATIFAELLAAREGLAIREALLFDSTGIVTVGRELGIFFGPDELEPGNLAGFQRVCNKDLKNSLLATALTVVAFGQIAIEQGNLPDYQATEIDDPLQCYLGALEFVDNFLDAKRKREELSPDVAGNFAKRRHTKRWQEAVEAAALVEDGVITRLRDYHGETFLEIGARDEETGLVLYDTRGNRIGLYTTFAIAAGKLGEMASVRDRKVKVLGGREGTLMEMICSAYDYPDREVVRKAQVKEVAGVVPLPPGHEEVFLKVVADGGKTEWGIEVITANKWHNAGKKLKSTAGASAIGVPSILGGQEEFFVAQASEMMGKKRADLAEEVGDDSSTSIVIVAKPMVSSALAQFRRKLIGFKQGKVSAAALASDILDNPNIVDSLISLRDRGVIDDMQHTEIAEAITHERERRKAEEKSRAAFVDSFGGGTEYMFGGGTRDMFGGGGSLKSLGLGTSLHVGSSGVAGGSYTVACGDFGEPDPFTPPKIFVLRPFGINGEIDEGAVGHGIEQIVTNLFSN